MPSGHWTYTTAIHDGRKGIDTLFVDGHPVLQWPDVLPLTKNIKPRGALGQGEYNSFFKGYIGEVIIFKTALSTQQRLQIERYLAHKYRFKIKEPPELLR